MVVVVVVVVVVILSPPFLLSFRYKEIVDDFNKYTLEFSAAHNGWMPLACASFFVKRIPEKPHGWWSLKGEGFDHPGISFSLDPLYGKPTDPIWEEFLKGAMKFAASKGGRMSPTQVSSSSSSSHSSNGGGGGGGGGNSSSSGSSSSSRSSSSNCVVVTISQNLDDDDTLR